MSLHEWYTNRETEERDYPGENIEPRDETERDWLDAPDIFRFENGFHNGPECKRCGRAACHHCNTSLYTEECPGA